MVNEGQQLSTKRKIEAAQYRTAAGRSIVLKMMLPESGLLSSVQTRSRLRWNTKPTSSTLKSDWMITAVFIVTFF